MRLKQKQLKKKVFDEAAAFRRMQAYAEQSGPRFVAMLKVAKENTRENPVEMP